MEKSKKYEREGTGLNINNRRSGGREQSGPKKQSKLLDCMQEIMQEMSVAGVMDLD